MPSSKVMAFKIIIVFYKRSNFYYWVNKKKGHGGHPPEDVGFREITNGYTSLIEWCNEVISEKWK